jgi:hypothetical protein
MAWWAIGLYDGAVNSRLWRNFAGESYRSPNLMTKMKQPGLDHRHRDLTGRIDKKHGNTRLKALRQEYGQHLAPGRRSDLMLKTLRIEAGGKSLSQILKAR